MAALLMKFDASRVCVDGSTELMLFRLILLASPVKLTPDDCVPGECVGELTGVWALDELRDSMRFFGGGEPSSPVVSAAFDEF